MCAWRVPLFTVQAHKSIMAWWGRCVDIFYGKIAFLFLKMQPQVIIIRNRFDQRWAISSSSALYRPSIGSRMNLIRRTTKVPSFTISLFSIIRLKFRSISTVSVGFVQNIISISSVRDVEEWTLPFDFAENCNQPPRITLFGDLLESWYNVSVCVSMRIRSEIA